ncbi:UbiA family prenyltransferase [Methanohalophilus levihalophilus]|uniref:UbiA family prenyltransferase n=1 Tax=Methanohalophilus levihalophilus TaxID=1431282 RepID=UPI001AE43D84|nr:UbiA family prenyltransferase [Methanohalophilus levihalophilus]
MAYISCVLQGLAITWEPLAIMFLVTYAVYNIDRKADEEEDSINHSERFMFTSKYSKFLFVSSVMAYLLAFVIAGFYGWEAVVVTSIPLVSGLLYSFAWLPKGFRYRRLKEIPSVKNLVIAFAWAFTPGLLPALIYDVQYSIGVLIALCYFFLLVFINTVVFDMRDIEGDSLSGIDTIPVLMGAEKTRMMLIALTIIFGVGMLFFGVSSLSIPALVVLVVGIFYALTYVLFSDRIGQTNAICDVMADGQFIILGCVLLAFTLTIGA